MKKFATTLFVLCLAAPAFAGPVRISQVYGGGGSSSATPPISVYQQDYVELHNVSASPAGVGGWVIAYASAAGLFGTNNFTLPAGATIPPCGYLLIAVGTAGTAGVPVPSPDFTNTSGPNISATDGKVALLSGGLPGTGTCPTGAVEDVVSFGAATACEGTPTGATARNTGLVRKLNGLQDGNDNLTDFDIVTGPTPRNSASPANPDCLATPARTSTWGTIKTLYR